MHIYSQVISITQFLGFLAVLLIKWAGVWLALKCIDTRAYFCIYLYTLFYKVTNLALIGYYVILLLLGYLFVQYHHLVMNKPSDFPGVPFSQDSQLTENTYFS